MSSQINSADQLFIHTQPTDQESLQTMGYTPASRPQLQRQQEETLFRVHDTPAQIDIERFIQNQNEKTAKLIKEFEIIKDNQANSRYLNAAVIGFIIGLTIFQFSRFISQSSQAGAINLNEGFTFFLLFTLAAALFNERKINQQTTIFLESKIFSKQPVKLDSLDKRDEPSFESTSIHL